jgi:hypothetical protein
MNVTLAGTRTEERQTVSVTFDVFDGPTLDTHSGGRWRPTGVHGAWTRHRVGGEDWTKWRWTGRMSGPKVRSNGTDSAVGYSVAIFLWESADMAEWDRAAVQAVEASRPGADLPA